MLEECYDKAYSSTVLGHPVLKTSFRGQLKYEKSLKQDFWHKPTLPSEHRKIGFIHFFCYKQAAHRL
jgi:hypothetical protein